MRRAKLAGVVLSLALAFGSTRAAAQSVAVPPIIRTGLEAIRTGGVEAALDAWLDGWGAEAASSGKAQLLPTFREIETVCGTFTGYDALGTAAWGPHTLRMYYVLLGKQRPAYLRFDVYQSDGRWRVLNVTINTDPAQVLTPEMLAPHG